VFDPKQLQEVAEGSKCYESSVAKTLAKNPERKENFTTGGGIPLKRT
jgi:methylmalonyl-CoA mutase N-terminal domain/subunit